MKSPQQQCEEYVRKQLPELMALSFGCEIVIKDSLIRAEKRDWCKSYTPKQIIVEVFPDKSFMALSKVNGMSNQEWDMQDIKEIIGHPIHLEHWLMVLRNEPAYLTSYIYGMNDTFMVGSKELTLGEFICFDLKTGQPREESYQPLADLLGLSEIE